MAVSIRLLKELDEGLTAAYEETGLSPQYIVDQAVGEWLERNGFRAGSDRVE